MSNDPTKPTDRWDIGKSNLLYNLAFLLLVMTVSHLFDLSSISRVLFQFLRNPYSVYMGGR